MAARPAPRSSRLANMHPVTAPATAAEPVKAPEAAPKADTPESTAPAAASSVSEPKTDAPAEPPRRKHRHKVSFYQAEADTERARGVLLNTMAHESYRSMTDFIASAVMEKVERMEAKYNDGKPFPNVKAGDIPQGRPLRG